MSKTISIDAIDDTNRLRPVDPAWVVTLAASIEESGLLQPIVVRPAGNRFTLTDGAHRLAALKSLGVEVLEVGEQVLVRDRSDDEARLAEIDTGLLRAELSPLDRALFLAERKDVYVRIHPETARGGDRRSEKVSKLKDDFKLQTLQIGLPRRFTSEVADKIGLGQRAVYLSLNLASKIAPEAIAHLRGTWLANNQQALLQLASEKPADQVAIVREIAKGEVQKLSDAKVALGLSHAVVDDPQTRLWVTLMGAWEKSNKRVRAQFWQHIGGEGPVPTSVPLPKPAKKG